MRRVLWICSVLVVVVVLVAAGGLVAAKFVVERSYPQTSGELELAELAAPVEVKRDRHGVPHLYADTAEDLFRAQGYVHAQDRFFEMDFRRHVTSGRLAEWFGPEQLDTDRVIRTLGWHRIAEQEFEALSASGRAYLQAYTAGVNAYLDERSGSRLSVEYTSGMLGPEEQPEAWSEIDSLAWLKAMAWDLSGNMNDEIERVIASTKVAPERVDELYPAYPADRNPTIVPGGRLVDGRFQAGGRPSAPQTGERPPLPGKVTEALQGVRRAASNIPSLLGDGDGLGSNAWAVSGKLTESGKPLLANDPHLSASMPSTWYQVGLHCRTVDQDCPFDVSGFSFAGMPGVIIGHNSHIGWGLTNLPADVADLYVERLYGDTYEVDGDRVPVDTRRETFRVKDRDEPVELDVRTTRNGPLISDVHSGAGRVARKAAAARKQQAGGREYGVALRWTALRPGRTADAIFALNRARNWDEFRSAAKRFEVPAQNLVYADRKGNIGYQAPGRIPVRGKGDGRWPAPGWDSSYQWRDDPIPFEALPSALNPKQGFVATANNAVVGADYPHHLADTWSYGYRARRITDRLQGADGLTVPDMQQIQRDSMHGNAKFLLPRLLQVDLDDPFVEEARDLLRNWDGRQRVGSPAAAYFNAVWKNLLERTFGDQLPAATWPRGDDRWYEVVRELLNRPRDSWWDDTSTNKRETASDMLRSALVEARMDLTRLLNKDPTKWRWGKLHTLEVRNETFGNSGAGALEWLFNRGPYPVPGGTDAVNANSWSAATRKAEAYHVSVVPSMRMVVDLDDLDRSRWVNLTGASGHPRHRHYDDQLDLWRRGQTTPFPFGAEAVERSTEDTLILRPGG